MILEYRTDRALHSIHILGMTWMLAPCMHEMRAGEKVGGAGGGASGRAKVWTLCVYYSPCSPQGVQPLETQIWYINKWYTYGIWFIN